MSGHSEYVKVLLQNGADVDAVDKYNDTALKKASGNEFNSCVLQLLCFGAKIDKKSLERDETGLLQPINNTLESLRAGNGMKTCLMSDEERRSWNLAFASQSSTVELHSKRFIRFVRSSPRYL